MVIKKLSLIVLESAANLRANDTLAYKCTNAGEWQDPYGGFFNEREQAELDEAARGRTQVVRLDSVKGGYRTVPCRVEVDF